MRGERWLTKLLCEVISGHANIINFNTWMSTNWSTTYRRPVSLTYLYLLSIESQLWSRDSRSPFWSAPDWTGVLWWSQPILLRTRSLPPELHLISTLGHSWHYGGFFFQFQSVTFLWLVSVSIFLILYQQSLEIYQDGDYWFLL